MAILTGYSQKKNEEGADNTIICDGGANKARNNINKGGDNLKVILDKVNSRLIAVEQSSGRTTSVNISGDYITRTQLASSISSAIANYYTKEQIDNMELGVEIAYVQVGLATSSQVEHLLYGEDSDDTQKLVVAVNYNSYYHYSHTDTDNDFDYFYFYNGRGEGYVLSSEDDSWTAITDNSFKSVTTNGTTGAGVLSLVAGSNITLSQSGNAVTINASSGGSSTQELYFATTSSTQQDIDTALTAGKLPVLKAGNPIKYYTYSYTGGTSLDSIHYFYAGDCSYYTVNRDDTWTFCAAPDNEDLFRCDTASTTSSQVLTALTNNKLPILVYDNRAYVFSHVTNDGSYNTYYFTAGDGTSYTLRNDIWTSIGITSITKWAITDSGTTNTFNSTDGCIRFIAGNNVSLINDTVPIDGSYFNAIQINASGGSSASSIPFGHVSSVTEDNNGKQVFNATISGITELVNGTCIMLFNGVETSAAGYTLNINNLGNHPTYSNMTNGTRDTTIFNVAYTMLFIYDATRVVDDITGAWCCYRGYNSNTDTIGYQIRTNYSTLPAKINTRRYRLLFTSADHNYWVAANSATSTNATSARTVTTEKIDPFGPIVYYGTTTAVDAGNSFGASYLWQQYNITLGYSFNRTGAALVLQYPKPVYIKCAPQTDGSAIIDADNPYVQVLPSTEDGKIYIYLGLAYSKTNVELKLEHPVYYYKDGAIRLWSNAIVSSGGSGGEANVIEAITFNGVAATITNKTAAITATIPTVPTNVSAFTNDANYVSSNNTVTIFSGSSTPSSSLGNNGDIYIQTTS